MKQLMTGKSSKGDKQSFYRRVKIALGKGVAVVEKTLET